MISIRHGTFETNSSSTHSMIIPTEPTGSLPSSLYFQIGSFGWGVEEVDHRDYLYTAILCQPEEKREELLERLKAVCYANGVTDLEFEEPSWDSWKDSTGSVHIYLDNGYIDHDADLDDFLDSVFESDTWLLNFLIGGRVGTGNDNTDESNPVSKWIWSHRNDEHKTFITCYKGN